MDTQSHLLGAQGFTDSSSIHQVTGVDLFFGTIDDDDEDPDEDLDDASEVDEVEEWIKIRWNLNARFGDAPRDFGLRPETFDLINSRMLCEGIAESRWQEYVSELHQMLKLGGWVQMVEIMPLVQSDNGSLTGTSFLTQWWNEYSQRMVAMNRDPRIGQRLEHLLLGAGFTRSAMAYGAVNVPIGNWRQGQFRVLVTLCSS
jgi:hypothetical protein